MKFHRSLRSFVVVILFVDLLFFLTFVRPYLQHLMGPHSVRNWFDGNAPFSIIVALSVWIVGWLVLLSDAAVFDREDDSNGTQLVVWGIANITGAGIGIILIVFSAP